MATTLPIQLVLPDQRFTSERRAKAIAIPFFVFLAFANASSLVAIASGPQTILSLSALLAKLCAMCFCAMIIWFTLIREEPLAQAVGLRPRLTALIGTFSAMAAFAWLKRPELSPAMHAASAMLVLIGTVLVIVTLRHLGRSFSIMPEARTLITTGPYAYVRHPMYLAELIATIGILIEFLSWPAVVVVATQLAFQIQRMRYEEDVLLRAFPKECMTYMARTSRLIPGVW